MITRTHEGRLLTLLAWLVWAAGAPALADEAPESPDTSNWACKLCIISSGWFGDWDLGIIHAGDPTPKFADYRGLDDDGAYLAADGTLRYRGGEGAWFDLRGKDLGLDSRSLQVRGGNGGKFGYHARYGEIPRFMGHGTQTPFLGIGTDRLTLPPAWIYEGGKLPGLPGALTPATLDSKRKTYGAGLVYRPVKPWKFSVDFERQVREGTRAFSAGLFAVNAAIFPAPIDYTTERFDMGVEFTGARSMLKIGLSGSDFDNGYRSVTWDNPFALGFGDHLARNALEPDNEFHQFSLAGSFRFSPRLRVSGRASMGEMKQNEPFIPYSTNPAHTGLSLPRDSLDGKLETSMFNLSARLHARLAGGLDLSASYKANERDNQTPVSEYTPVLFEVYQTAPRSNRPYSYERAQAGLELRYRPGGGYRLAAGVKRDALERTFQSVRETEEDTIWGEIRVYRWEKIGLRFKFDNQDRSATPYQQLVADRAENPLMRKFNLAERDRERVAVDVDLALSGRLGVNLGYYTTDDEYGASVLGLKASEEDSFSLELHFSAGEQANLHAFYTRDDIDSWISGDPGAGAVPWNSTTEDTTTTWGVGLSGQFRERFTWGLDHVSSDSESDIRTAGGGPFPLLMTELRNTRVYLRHEVSEHWGWGLDIYREAYDSTDWLVDGVAPDSIATMLTMGETSPDYDVNVIRLSAKYRF